MIVPIAQTALPFIVLAGLYFWSYGLRDLSDFSGWGALRLFGPILLVFHLILLVTFGEEFFCGYCSYKDRSGVFLYSGIGYGLMTFPAAATGNVFNSTNEKLAELFVYLVGVAMVCMGVIWFLAKTPN